MIFQPAFYSNFRYLHRGLIYYTENAQSVGEIPLEKLIGQGIKIDVYKKALQNPNYLISIEDLQNWEKEYGEIPTESIVLLQIGYGQFYPDAKKYLGTKNRGEDAVKELHFPGLSPEVYGLLKIEILRLWV